MAMERAPLFPYYRSPAKIRGEVFTHRMRGLDPDEVHEYLDLIADQVQALENERGELFDEIDRLRAELAGSGGRARRTDGHETGAQAASLLDEAQRVADQLVEEAVAHTRELLATAHQQQREILAAAHDAAEATAREAARASARDMASYVSASAPEVEYARRFTQVAQVQLRSVLEALCEQVEQLGQVSRLWQQTPLAAYAVQEPRRDRRGDVVPAQPAYRAPDALFGPLPGETKRSVA